jgi:hypothetical protein
MLPVLGSMNLKYGVLYCAIKMRAKHHEVLSFKKSIHTTVQHLIEAKYSTANLSNGSENLPDEHTTNHSNRLILISQQESQ